MTKNNSAEDILLKYSNSAPPVDVLQACKNEGITVQIENLTELEEKFNRPISGLLYFKNNPIILVNRDDIPTRQRFTIAHELGHYLLHMKDSHADGDIMISFRGLRSKEETEADHFAADLLMPKDAVMKEHQAIPYPTVSYLSRAFGVSAAAMRYRLDEMGLSYIG